MQHHAVEVRPRRPEDVKPLTQVLRDVYDSDGYPVEGAADPKAWLTDPQQVAAWTALLDGTPVGNVSLFSADPSDPAVTAVRRDSGTPVDQIRVLARLFVSPAGRGHGIGATLTRKAMSEIQRARLTGVLDVMQKDRTARRLYERLGWVRTGQYSHGLPGGASVPALAYVLRASPETGENFPY